MPHPEIVITNNIDHEWKLIQLQLKDDPRSKSRRERIENPVIHNPLVIGQVVPAQGVVGSGSSEYEVFSGRGWKIHLTVVKTSREVEGGFALGPNEARLFNYIASRGLFGKVEHEVFSYGNAREKTGSTLYIGGINEAMYIARDIERQLGDILGYTREITFARSSKRIAVGSGSDRYLVPSGKIVGRMEIHMLGLPGMEYDNTNDILWETVGHLFDPVADAQFMGIQLLPEYATQYHEIITAWKSCTLAEQQAQRLNVREALIKLIRKNRKELSIKINESFAAQGINQSGCGPNYVYTPKLDN